MASPILQGALKDGFGEAVVACDMPGPCKFPSLGSCQKMWTLAPHLVVGLVPKVGHEEKFYQALGFESHDPFLRVSKQGPCLTAVEEDGGDQRRGGSCRFCFAILLPLLTLKEKT